MASAWWDINREMSTPELNKRRDERYAARIRGALAALRKEHGEEAVLLLPLHLPQLDSVLAALNMAPTPEEISSTPTDTRGTEEE